MVLFSHDSEEKSTPFSYAFQSYIGSIFSLVEEHKDEVPAWAFNPILVLFSRDCRICAPLFSTHLSILYWFYFLRLIIKLRRRTTVLSILYWFYFLPPTPRNTRGNWVDFQSYIGSIFSPISISVSLPYTTFNPILVLFSPAGSSSQSLSVVLSILYWFYFLYKCFHFYFTSLFTFNPILVLFSLILNRVNK